MRMELGGAIDEIRQGVADAKASGERASPFFFVVGAGISVPSIPTAREIEDICRNRLPKASSRIAFSGSAMEKYSYWFGRAFPQPRQRQAFLEELMKEKPVSAANLRLGHLLIEQTVSGLVLTSNFDPFIADALRLFGVEHIVFDHPLLADRIDPDRAVVQVVHMHGSHWHYDACNLVAEIGARAAPQPRARRSMLHLIEDTLRFRSPLVIGYSGWLDDVFMQAFHERLGDVDDSVALPYNAYWFCHRRGLADELPPWLASHPNMRLVLPPEQKQERARGATKVDELLEPARASPAASGTEATLDAQEVFEALLQAFSVDLPAITVDPLASFASDLRRRLPHVVSAPAADIYRIDAVLAQVERAGGLLSDAVSGEAQALRRIDDAIRGSNYIAAVREAKSLSIEALEPPVLEELLEATWVAGISIPGNPLLKADAFALVAKIAERLGLDDQARRSVAADALRFRAAELRGHGRRRPALQSIDQSIELLRGMDPEPTTPLIEAFLLRGTILWDSGKYEDEMASYDEALRYFSHGEPPDAAAIAARALDFKATTLSRLGRYESAADLLNELTTRFGDSSDPDTQAVVIRALTSAGVFAESVAHRIGFLGRASELHRDSDDQRVIEARAEALVRLGIARRVNNEPELARAAFTEVLDRYEGSRSPGMQEEIGYAYLALGRLEREAGRDEAALPYLDAVRNLEPLTSEVIDRQIQAAELALQIRFEAREPVEEEIGQLIRLTRGVRSEAAVKARTTIRELQLRSIRRRRDMQATESSGRRVTRPRQSARKGTPLKRAVNRSSGRP